MAEDARGVLWIGGSSTGLYSFDPLTEKFVNYRPQAGNKNSLISESVWTLVTDYKGVVWVGTSNGLDKFDPVTKSFTHFQHAKKDPTTIRSNKIFGLVKDESDPDILWIVHQETLGIDCFNIQTGKVIRHFNFPFTDPLYSSYFQLLSHLNPDLNVFGMKNGNIWIGSNDYGIFGFNARTGQYSVIKMKKPCNSPDHIMGFYHVAEDAESNLWTTNDNNEIVYYNNAASKFYFYPVKESNIRFKETASVIFPDKSSKIWICTNDGLLTVDARQKKIFN
jgi:ligand-binding sensor domain-containing protein